MSDENCVVIVGGGIGGLTLALSLHRDGVPFRVFEAVADIKPLGVGLNLLPHAMRELAALGLVDRLRSMGVEPQEYRFFTRHGQLIQQETRGVRAGYEWPQVAIHRADLHAVLLDALRERAGPEAIALGQRCVSIEQDEQGATVHLVDSRSGQAVEPVRARAVIACDGVNSVARVQMHPREAVPRYQGTVMYRGTTRWKPFLGGSTHFYLGTVETGKLIMYPIRNDIDAEGRQLINWVVEVNRPQAHLKRDWNRRCEVDEFIGSFEACTFDWLDIPAILRAADAVYEYPMIDQDPLPFWTRGYLTLLGDAAHPMMPRGSNGAAQAIIDAATLSRLLAKGGDPRDALKEYERIRLEATANVVLANRGIAPDGIIQLVEERTGGKPFARIEDVVSPQELAQWQERYRKVAGFSLQDLEKQKSAQA